jgi:hypothetical protein
VLTVAVTVRLVGAILLLAPVESFLQENILKKEIVIIDNRDIVFILFYF